MIAADILDLVSAAQGALAIFRSCDDEDAEALSAHLESAIAKVREGHGGTAAHIRAAIDSLSEEECKAVRNAANERARALESARHTAHMVERFAYFAALPLGTKIRYTNPDATSDRIAGRLGFLQSGEWELRAVKKGRKYRGIWLATRFDDHPDTWRWVDQTHLMSDRWSAVVTPVEP